VTLTIQKVKRLSTIVLHIPNWADNHTVSINGEPVSVDGTSDAVTLSRKWKKGDIIELNLPMRPRLIEANPLVEEAKNQIAVMRGPIVYCLEGQDIADGIRINDIILPADIRLTEKKITIDEHEMIALEGDALITNTKPWNNQTLYRDLRPATKKKVHIRLIPYYAWDNRGIDDMSLWLPVSK
jgi:hypothetical protein